MDIGGTAKKIQRATKVAEESYKKMQTMMEKMQEMMEQMQRLQRDMETTSKQVDGIEYTLATQHALIEALAEEQGLDVEEVLTEADLPDPPVHGDEEDDETTEENPADLAKKATSRPSAGEDA